MQRLVGLVRSTECFVLKAFARQPSLVQRSQKALPRFGDAAIGHFGGGRQQGARILGQGFGVMLDRRRCFVSVHNHKEWGCHAQRWVLDVA